MKRSDWERARRTATTLLNQVGWSYDDLGKGGRAWPRYFVEETIRAIDEILEKLPIETGPENSREEVSPMGRSPQRDCSNLHKLAQQNLSTMREQRARISRWGKSTAELDMAIDQTAQLLRLTQCRRSAN